MAATNTQDLRELIQGPGDVEWRYVAPLCFQTREWQVTVKRRYDMRHQCQEILPGLLLGPFQVSKNLATLKELRISHMYASCHRNFHTGP
jgi:serine/threonine/tyrosine-interacting protein